jgi:DNA end-binding protein Ku
VPDEDHAPRAPRALWSGSIAFGLVSIPVSLLAAIRPSRTALRMVDRDGTPLVQRYLCSREDRVLQNDEIVRGYEIEKDHYVVVSDEELEALAPEQSREIDLKRFVPLPDIDPMYFERGYFLAPERGGTKAYRLLAHILEETGRAGVATFVLRGKEHLVAIIAERGILRAETLRFDDELRSPSDVGLPEPVAVSDTRTAAVTRALGALPAEALDRALLSDRQEARLLALIEEKRAASRDVVPALDLAPEHAEGAELEPDNVVDLMQVLRRSLDEQPATAPPEGGGRAAARGRPPSRDQMRKLSGTPLSDRSKSELYALAQELEIAGRSAMSKGELIEAIRKAR